MSEQDIFVEHGKSGKPLKEVFVMDTHCHLGQSPRLTALDSSVESLIPVMDRLGIDFTALTSTPAAACGVITRGNDQVIDAVQRYPDRFFGYMSVNPSYPRAAAGELQRCLDAGLRGIKVVYLQGTMYDHPSYEMVWEFAAEHNMIVLAHTGGETGIVEIEPCFTRYPNVTWIMAHAGMDGKREIYVRVAREYPNVYADLVNSACQRGQVEYFIEESMEDKLLWGTDMHFMSAQPQLGKVLFAGISPEQKAKILGLNARRVFNLK